MSEDGKTYVVSDGDLLLHLTEAEDGWYAVSTPLDPHVHTQAKTIPEAFMMARDAMELLRQTRAEYIKQIDDAMSKSA